MDDSIFQTIIEKAKEGYFFFEDRYYALLDKVNKYVPIYKVVDPIDKVVPSFVLLIALVIMLVVISVFLSASAVPFIATLQVVDDKGESLEGVAVELTLGERTTEYFTDDWGEIELEITAEEVEADASLSKDGFISLNRTITLVSNERASVTMQTKAPVILGPDEFEKTIKVVDNSTSQLLMKEVTLSFQCSGGAFSPTTQIGSTGEFFVTQPSNCLTLIATAVANGYSSKSKTLASKINYINLTENVVETTGNINVIVKDSEENPEPDVIVRAISSASGLEAATGSTTLSGNVLLNSLAPGTYTISATAPDGRTGQETGVSVAVGQTEYVNVTLPSPNQADIKKINLKLVELGTSNPVAEALALIYEDSVPVDSTTSGDSGLIEKRFNDSDSSYLVVITHPDFISHIEPDVPLQELSNTTPITIGLIRADTEGPNPTSATAVVTVVDEDLELVEDALVTIYNSQYPEIPLKSPPGRTIADGTYTFTNLAPGTYFAKAWNEEESAQGQSSPGTVAAGESLPLQVSLILGVGTVEAKVFDAESALKDPIASSEVEFIDAYNFPTVLATCTTDATGKCESEPIPADKFVAVRASAPGYISTYATSSIDIVNRNKSKVDIGLRSDSSIPGTCPPDCPPGCPGPACPNCPPDCSAPYGAIDVEFQSFCQDKDCDRLASKIQSDALGTTTYYALFWLQFKGDLDYSNTVQHVRVGPDLEINLPLPNGYKIKLMDSSGPLISSAPLSKCWNNDPVDPFMEPLTCAVDRSAKQANLYYPDFDGRQAIPFVVEFDVEPGLDDGTQLEMRYKAKTTVDGTQLFTEEKLLRFHVNEVFCEGQEFAWSFELETLDGSITVPESGPESLNLLEMNQEYLFSYSIYNCSGINYSSASVAGTNLEPHAISFTPTEPYDFGPTEIQAPVAFSNNTELSNQFSINTVDEVDLTTLELSFGTETNFSLETLGFKIESGSTLRVIHAPTTLRPNVSGQSLVGTVTDSATGSSLEDAFVKLTVEAGQELKTRTNFGGNFVIGNIEQLEGTSIVTLTIIKAGYATFEKNIEIGERALPLPNPNLDCITIEKDGSAEVSINFVKSISNPPTAHFNVKSDCAVDVKIKLESELKVNPSIEFTLTAGNTWPVSVDGETWDNSPHPIYAGEYAVYVMARFTSDDPLAGLAGPLQTARIYVRDPNSSFRLADPEMPNNTQAMKSSFDIRSEIQDGLIINKKYVYFEDVSMPRLENAYGFLPVEGMFSLIYTPLRQPGVEKVKQIIFDPMQDYFVNDNKAVIDFVDNAGYVFVEWIDFFMTDKSHNDGDRHRVWAQTHNNVWSNITGQLPYTPVSSTRDLNEPIIPIVDNFGWVDTETFYPQNSKYDDELTTMPIWQGQHNVCNLNLEGFGAVFKEECRVPGYFGGGLITPYKVGNVANKIALESENLRTKLSAARWRYISTDKPHGGLIDFRIRNNTLMGETFALLEVEDTVGIRDLPAGGGLGGVTVDWSVSKRGILVRNNTLNLLNRRTTVDEDEILAISVDGTTPPRVFANLNQACIALRPSVPKELTSIEFTSNDDSPEFRMPGQGREPNIAFYTCFGSNTSAPAYFDIEESGAHDTIYFVQPDGKGEPRTVDVVAFKNNSNDPLIVDNVTINYITREANSIVLGTGQAIIPLGQSFVEFDPPGDKALPGNYEYIEYIVEDTTPAGIVYFSDTLSNISPDPYSSSTKIIAATTSPEQEGNTDSDKFHIRLIGQSQEQCFGTGGIRGSTGPGSKPRVLLNWDWADIDTETCSGDNPGFVYCDPTQFTVSLVKRLEEMKQLAEEDLTGNLLALTEMKEFTVYLIEDAYTTDFRNDFVDFYANKMFEDELTNPEHPWRNYVLDTERLVFETGSDSKLVEAGLHEVYIQLDFDEDQFDFFYIEGEGEAAVVDLLADIKVHITKASDPIIQSPFYYLPFNGSLGFEDGEYSRDGYGLVFNNSSEPLVLVSDIGGTFYSTDTSGSSTGRTTVGTYRETDFDAINISDRGMLMQVAQDQSQINFAPSIATPVLLEMVPEVGVVDTYYYLRDQDEVAISAASFMNLWNGSGSTMEIDGACVDFFGNRLQFRIQDRVPESGSCAANVEGSYGFNYNPATENEKLYFETVFYMPVDKIAFLRKSCDNGSNFYAPGPSGTQRTDTISTPVELSVPDSRTKVATIEDIINLIEEEYVCISSDQTFYSFWWNPQKVLQDLDSIKTGIYAGWDSELKCDVIPG